MASGPETAASHETSSVGDALLTAFGLEQFRERPLKRRDGTTMLRPDGEPMTAVDYPVYADPTIGAMIETFVRKHRGGTATGEEHAVMLAITTGYMQLVQDMEGHWVGIEDAAGNS